MCAFSENYSHWSQLCSYDQNYAHLMNIMLVGRNYAPIDKNRMYFMFVMTEANKVSFLLICLLTSYETYLRHITVLEYKL